MLIHAAVVGKSSLAIFARRLTGLGFRVHNLAYPNRRLSIIDCAGWLLQAWQALSAACDGHVHLAGHSMGGLVARRLIHLHCPPNMGRLVTMGTPHLGSPLADIFHRFKFYQAIFGPAGQDLVTGRPIDWLCPWPPPCETGCIAGKIPIGPGTPLMTWDSDGTVSRASAHPFGAKDYLLVPSTHTTIPFLKRTAEASAAFFHSGSFASAE